MAMLPAMLEQDRKQAGRLVGRAGGEAAPRERRGEVRLGTR